jgi:hypothetical protein
MKPLALAALLAAVLCSGCQRQPNSTPVVPAAKLEQNDGTANHKPSPAPNPQANSPAPVPLQPAISTPAKDAKLELAILAWNIESGCADNQVILAQMKELAKTQFHGTVDIIALSETPPNTEDLWKSVLPGGVAVMGTTGDSDRLCIVFNGERFEQVRVIELAKFEKFTLNPGNQRSPLIVHLKDKATGDEFMVLNNHLARGNADQRKTQALGLSAWAREQNLPMIAVGDYNFDYDFPTKSGNEAFRAFLADGVWKWNEPKELIDSNWADRDKDGKDDFPDSLLDMVFTAGPAKEWTVTAEIIVREGDFPDDEKTSDHRPSKVLVKAGK